MGLLHHVMIQSPCTADWNEMKGDEKSRHCQLCNLNVFNLSAMTTIEAEALLQAQSNKRLCVRYYQRPDGTVMTADCLSVRALHHKKARLLRQLATGQTLVASVLVVTLIGFFTPRAASAETLPQASEPTITITGTPNPEQPKALGPLLIPPQAPPPVIMGGIHPVEPPPYVAPEPAGTPPLKPCKEKKEKKPRATNSPKPPVLMGKIAAPRQ